MVDGVLALKRRNAETLKRTVQYGVSGGGKLAT